jgi:prepilin-type N-terminal cleavage/methylation domain-containing protein
MVRNEKDIEMKRRSPQRRWNPRRGSMAFTLIEVMVAVAISGIVFVGLYSGISSGFAIVELARENLRAGQILQEKMETIRLYTWSQITTDGFVPTNFTEFFFTSTQSASGLTYTGTVNIVAAPISESYSNDIKSVTVQVKWTSAGVLRSRDMVTFVSRYGLQNYIY